MKFKSVFYVILFSLCSYAQAYKELVPDFKRIGSVVTVRKIDNPTLANLDCAAYDKNPVLFENVKLKVTPPPNTTIIDTIKFGGVLNRVVDNIDSIKLSDYEKKRPYAWKPLLKKMWSISKDMTFQEINGKVNSFKWADPSVFQQYQDITSVYLLNKNGVSKMWIKIEFAPWVKFLNDVSDEDRDGFREIYGELNIDKIPADTLLKIVSWMNNDYAGRILDDQEVTDWITDLASYWYPSKNTDILPVVEKWPEENTKKSVKKQLKGLVIDKPFAVVEAKPYSPEKPIYNVYIVSNPVKKSIKTDNVSKTDDTSLTLADTAISENFVENNARFSMELKNNGSYTEWERKNGNFTNALKTWVSFLPESQMGIECDDNWLFFRKSIEYMFCGDLSFQTQDKNPLYHVKKFKNYLKDRNVNMLFVVVPNKEDVYFNKLNKNLPKPEIELVNPYNRKILKQLQDNGVEVIDLLPEYLDEKKKDSLNSEALYQLHDTHWSDRGLQIAVKKITERVKHYSWYSGIEKEKYTIVDTVTTRLGDIVERLPVDKQELYKPTLLNVKQVKAQDGTLYNGNRENAPILLIGDSFTGVFESVDCKSAGVGANIAANTGIGVDIITSWGGGPLVRKKAMRVREKNLPQKKLVIYMMVARDLYNYAQKWEEFPEK